MGFDILNPSSWKDPFVDAGNAIGDVAVDVAKGAEQAARDAAGIAEVVGDGIVDGAKYIGEGVVTAGTSIEKWSVAASGDVVDWSKTSFAEVRDWTENAAGQVEHFTLANYDKARDAVGAGIKWAYEQLAAFFYETLPELGPTDATAEQIARFLLTGVGADGLRTMARQVGCVLTFGLSLRVSAIKNTIGLYVCGDGWGFFQLPNLLDVKRYFLGFIQNPGDLTTASLSADVTMGFGPVSRVSRAKVLKFGLSLNSTPAKDVGVSIGGVVLMEATMPPLFFGVRYSMSVDTKLFGKSKDDSTDSGQPKWKVDTTLPMPNSNFALGAADKAESLVAVGWDELTSGLSAQATCFDAALRAHADPGSADRIQATALAAATVSFKPRYYGVVRTLSGGALVADSRTRTVGVGTAGDRTTIRIVAGLTDPTGVSLQAVGEPALYYSVASDGSVGLIPYDRKTDMRSATFTMVRGRAGRGISLAVSSDPATAQRFLAYTRVNNGVVLPAPVLCACAMGRTVIEGPSSNDVTFLLDRPQEEPAATTAVLRAGQYIRAGGTKYAANGLFYLLLHAGTGRLVMCQRGVTALDSPTGWLPYTPGMVQDDATAWAWATPPLAAVPATCHARLTAEGRLAVVAGAGPAQAGATLWQSDVIGSPGPCFLAVTNEGALLIVRGTPEDAGEIVWSSAQGALYWPTRRRQVVLRGVGGFLSARNGGGIAAQGKVAASAAEPVTATAKVVSGWEVFELQELCTGQVALRAQGRRYVGVDPSGTALQCQNDQVGPRELFQMLPSGDANTQPPAVQLRTAVAGANVAIIDHPGTLGTATGVPSGWGGATIQPVPRPGLGTVQVTLPVPYSLQDVDVDLTLHSGRLLSIVAGHSGMALEVPNGYTDNGRGLMQGDALTAKHQKWTLRHVGGGWFTLVNAQTGLAIDIYGGQTGAGAAAIQWPLHGGPNQCYSFTPVGDGYYAIHAKHSGLALTVEGASGARGARILQSPYTGANNQRWKVTLASPAETSPWTALGGGLLGSPSITSWGPGRIDIFARGLDNAIYQIGYEGKWSGWLGHGGGLLNDPAASAQQPNRLDVMARGTSGGVFQIYWNGSWSSWVSLGASTTTSPVLLTPRVERWDLFILQPNGSIGYRIADHGWRDWVSLGGNLLDAPAAVHRDGRYDLFSRGQDRAIYQNTCVNGTWSGWSSLGGVLAGAPAAVSTAAGCVDLFALGTDARVWTRSLRAGVWRDWLPIAGRAGADPGALSADLSAISIAADRIDLFARAGDGALWHARQVAGTWLPWRRLGPLTITGKPALTSSGPGRVDIAVINADKAVWYYRMVD